LDPGNVPSDFYSNSALLRTRGDAGTSGKPHDRKGKARDAGPLKVEEELGQLSGSLLPRRNKAKIGRVLYFFFQLSLAQGNFVRALVYSTVDDMRYDGIGDHGGRKKL
jgi:hypothetical protein